MSSENAGAVPNDWRASKRLSMSLSSKSSSIVGTRRTTKSATTATSALPTNSVFREKVVDFKLLY
jgi:hypothetical protein